jgi:hypothetical protein
MREGRVVDMSEIASINRDLKKPSGAAVDPCRLLNGADGGWLGLRFFRSPGIRERRLAPRSHGF